MRTAGPGEIVTFHFEALGGTCELFALAPQGPLERTADWIRGLHRRLTRFDPASELSRFNTGAGQWCDVSPEMHDLLSGALRAFEESGGLVNVAVLPALFAAGYDRTFEDVGAGTFSQWVPVLRHQIDDGCHRSDDRSHVSFLKGPPLPLNDVLELRAGAARLAPGAAIDLGGIAKGWIADRAVERMGPNSLANCGGDLYARGGGPDGDGWPVAFADRTLLLQDRGAATSGTTKRRWGAGLHHLIDPRTGAPALTDLSEVSVLADTASHAEVFAKTALLLGSVAAPAFLEGRSAGWALS